MRNRYYSLKNILAKNAQYNVIFGQRSNGKTYAVKKYGLEQYVKDGKQIAYVRRWAEDFTGKRGSVLFDDLVSNGEVSKITGGEWTGVYYYGSKWYLCRYEDGKRIADEMPFCYGFSISAMEHDKSTSYPLITTVCFDEFLSRSMYLPDEFILFENLLSTIIRDRDDVRIFMLGNTVNKYCPYFKEMGLTHIREQERGTIDVYHYGESALTVAVEFCAPNKAGKQSDLYFAFDNPRLQMITGHGNVWEMSIYPHCPIKYAPKDIQFTYFIDFDGNLLQCEIILKNGSLFTFIHPKTTDLKDIEHDLIFSQEYHSAPNFRRKITRPVDEIGTKIAYFFKAEKVFFADNETGEVVRNYLMWCESDKM